MRTYNIKMLLPGEEVHVAIPAESAIQAGNLFADEMLSKRVEWQVELFTSGGLVLYFTVDGKPTGRKFKNPSREDSI